MAYLFLSKQPPPSVLPTPSLVTQPPVLINCNLLSPQSSRIRHIRLVIVPVSSILRSYLVPLSPIDGRAYVLPPNVLLLPILVLRAALVVYSFSPRYQSNRSDPQSENKAYYMGSYLCLCVSRIFQPMPYLGARDHP